MQQWIQSLLTFVGWPSSQTEIGINLFGLLALLLVALISHYIVKHKLVTLVSNIVSKSKNQWDDLFLTHNVFDRLALLVPFFILLIFTPAVLAEQSSLTPIVLVIAKVAITFQIARGLCALLDVVYSVYKQKAKARYLPLNATIQLIKLAIYLVSTILSISTVIDRSPVFLLSGLGAITAVLLLVFQDTIKGLVASIQIAANKMVAPGDWVELPQYGADGDVLEIGLTTVKIQNFDKTVTTVPTYALTSGSFKNWRDMFNSGGRRIKRAIFIDIASIAFYKEEDLERLANISLLQPYLARKRSELAEFKQAHNIAEEDKVNQRQLTNVGTYRAYIEAYLRQHEKVHQHMTCMVRQLATASTGLPLELYFFSNDQDWVNYEGIQADIFDHLYAIAPEFGLRVFQHPTGHDWQVSQKR